MAYISMLYLRICSKFSTTNVSFDRGKQSLVNSYWSKIGIANKAWHL